MIEFLENKKCSCGKVHTFDAKVFVGEGTVRRLPDILRGYEAHKIFMLADNNTYAAAGALVDDMLVSEGFEVLKYIFTKEKLEPDESNVGLAFMNFDPSCDVLLGVGSGVINDICKIISTISKKTYIIVGTAPSMDGYVSATSSMTVAGLKKSLQSRCPDVVIGDTDILCRAPVRMMVSGIGDMLAKYVSICEWRISHLINGEYYCEEIAKIVRKSLKKCVDNSDGLIRRDKEAVQSVFEGLILCGAAMNYAGISRPASGVEHYISHIWDMRAVAFGTPMDFHGIQCAIGTLVAARVYEKLEKYTPDREKALKYVEKFDFDKWSKELRAFVGGGAEDMIKLEGKEHKYDKKKHAARLEKIIANWDKIIKIAREELPSSSDIEKLLIKLHAPTQPSDIGIDNSLLPMTFKASKDIRDKYVLSRLCWDLGIIDEII